MFSYNEGNSQHLQLWCQIKNIVSHEAIKITVDLLNTLHCTGTPHIRFQSLISPTVVTVVVAVVVAVVVVVCRSWS